MKIVNLRHFFLPRVFNSGHASSKFIVSSCRYAFPFSIEILPVFLPSFLFGFHTFILACLGSSGPPRVGCKFSFSPSKYRVSAFVAEEGSQSPRLPRVERQHDPGIDRGAFVQVDPLCALPKDSQIPF